MKRKTIILILLFVYTLALNANVKETLFEPASITFSPEGKVFAGFTTQLVTNLMPVDESIKYGDNAAIDFKYDDASKSFMTEPFYYYAQIFTANPVKVTVSFGNNFNLLGEKDQTPVGFNVVSSTIGNVSTSNTITEEAEVMPDPSTYEQHGRDNFTEEPPAPDVIAYPTARLVKGDIRLQVPLENVGDMTQSYSTTCTLRIEAKEGSWKYEDREWYE